MRIPFLSFLLLCTGAFGFTGLPPTRHHQFLNLATLTEEKTGIVMREGGRAWGGIAANVSLVELSEFSFKPQLVLYGIVDVSFRSNTWAFDFLTETFDARFGMAWESVVDESLRFSVGLLHYSGHTADSVLNPELVPPNMGDDVILGRVVYDYGKTLRLGLTLRPAINSDPRKQFFGAEQFVEWFPWGGNESATSPSPFLAAALEEDGPRKIELNYHIQAGVHLGNHFSEAGRQSMRVVIGYYDGLDPRLKYGRIKQTRSHFVFAGLWFNI